MAEASRLEACEKDIKQLQTWVRDLLAVVKENREDLSSQEDMLQDLSNGLAAAENEISSLNERISGESNAT